MKRIFSFLLIFILVFSFCISAFASELPMPKPVHSYGQGVIVQNSFDGSVWYLCTTGNFTFTSNGSSYNVDTDNDYLDFYKWAEGLQVWSNQSSNVNLSNFSEHFPFGFSVLYSYGDYFTGTLAEYRDPSTFGECDGSLCPANDADHNNICDDCGKVLTMSLRSTLLDYAIFHANEGASYYGFSYFTIFYAAAGDDWDSKYTVYLSKSPLTSNGGVYIGEDMRMCTVQQTALGENGATGWSAFDGSISVSTEIAYTNHEINFPLPPLKETVQEATEGALMKEAWIVAEQMKTITIVAVSCLALWALLETFLKVFRTFRVK